MLFCQPFYQPDFKIMAEAVRAWCAHNGVKPDNVREAHEVYAVAIRLYCEGHRDLEKLSAGLIAELDMRTTPLISSAVH
jgi:hypothetical protein